MIRRLQIKFVVINMSIVVMMLCLIFGLIYHFTSANLEIESINMMKEIAMHPLRIDVPKEFNEEMRLPYFTVQLGANGELVAKGGGYYDLSDEELLNHFVKAAFDTPKNFGVIKDYNLRYYRSDMPFNQCLVFADISSEIVTLNNLIKNSILIGFLSFLGFLMISIFLARWAIQPVDKAWKQQQKFVADASHELKTPLTVIMTNTELLLDSAYSIESKRKFLDHIAVVSKQMRDLIERMLELARADNSQLEMSVNNFDFSKLVSNGILPFDALFFEKDLTLEVEIEQQIQVKGGEAELLQVVEILLDNAKKYSKERGTTWVTLKRNKRGHCLLCVANEGEAIEQEDIQNIFKRFYRSDKARSRNGSFGLGLSIAQSIITKHGGKIWAESQDGINSFYVELSCSKQ